MVKEFGRHTVACVGEGRDKDMEVAKWRTFYITETEEVNDQVQHMVAGLKMVCQSIDLVEGAVFAALEPYGINAEAIQSGIVAIESARSRRESISIIWYMPSRMWRNQRTAETR